MVSGPTDKAVLLVESQPPHVGEIVTFLSNVNRYKKLFVWIVGKPSVAPFPVVMGIWSWVISAYKKKSGLILMPQDVINMTDIPSAFKDFMLVTTDKKWFTHLSTMNFQVELVAKTRGYHEIFERVAYRQGLALDWLLASGIQQTTNVREKKKV